MSASIDSHYISNTHSHIHEQQSRFDVLTRIIEKISAIALGAFSLYTNQQLFFPYFFLGCCIGIYSYIKDKELCGGHHPRSSCAHGLLEELTGTKLPPIVSLIANVCVTICHIDHHSNIFVPIVGVSLGNWMGKTASHYGVFAYKKITEYKYSI